MMNWHFPVALICAVSLIGCVPPRTPDATSAAVLIDFGVGDLGFFRGRGSCEYRPQIPFPGVFVLIASSGENQGARFSVDRVADAKVYERRITVSSWISTGGSRADRTRLTEAISNAARSLQLTHYCVILRADQRLRTSVVYDAGRTIQEMPGASLMLFAELALDD